MFKTGIMSTNKDVLGDTIQCQQIDDHRNFF